MYRARSVLVLVLLTLSPLAGQTPPPEAAAKFARSRAGMVSSGSVFATAAGIRMLEQGGNAIDAAAAACFALMVTDPANTSLGGRAQILLRLRDGRVIAIDGATEAPRVLPPLADAKEDRQGYQVAPVPGALAALHEMSQRHGKLRFADVLQPAIQLAEEGFAVPPRLAATWERTATALQKNPGAAQNFLHPDGSAYRAGERFRQPRLARVLREIAASGPERLYRGPIAETIVEDVSRNGGFLRASDLASYRAQPGVAVRTSYRGYQVVSAGGRAWGNTLAEMLNILSNFSIAQREPTAADIEILARTIAQAMDDRPQTIGSLKPKPNGYALSRLSSPAFGRERAARIRREMPPAGTSLPQIPEEDHDTTHLSVMDAEGNAVSLTTSIGPSFGARVATPELGFLYAHSYRMRSDPTPSARDLTEMTPTIVFQHRRAILALGGAGSERIPTAILQVLSNLLDRGWTLERAMTAPRIFCLNRNLRVHEGFPPAVLDALRARGFEIELVPADASRHQGLVHAVQYDPKTQEFFGAADLGDSGSAGRGKTEQ